MLPLQPYRPETYPPRGRNFPQFDGQLEETVNAATKAWTRLSEKRRPEFHLARLQQWGLAPEVRRLPVVPAGSVPAGSAPASPAPTRYAPTTPARSEALAVAERVTRAAPLPPVADPYVEVVKAVAVPVPDEERGYHTAEEGAVVPRVSSVERYRTARRMLSRALSRTRQRVIARTGAEQHAAEIQSAEDVELQARVEEEARRTEERARAQMAERAQAQLAEAPWRIERERQWAAAEQARAEAARAQEPAQAAEEQAIVPHMAQQLAGTAASAISAAGSVAAGAIGEVAGRVASAVQSAAKPGSETRQLATEGAYLLDEIADAALRAAWTAALTIGDTRDALLKTGRNVYAYVAGRPAVKQVHASQLHQAIMNAPLPDVTHYASSVPLAIKDKPPVVTSPAGPASSSGLPALTAPSMPTQQHTFTIIKDHRGDPIRSYDTIAGWLSQKTGKTQLWEEMNKRAGYRVWLWHHARQAFPDRTPEEERSVWANLSTKELAAVMLAIDRKPYRET
jgi:hypothetical protein